MNFFRYKTLGFVRCITIQSIWALIEFERGSNREHRISFKFEVLKNQLYKCALLCKTVLNLGFFTYFCRRELEKSL